MDFVTKAAEAEFEAAAEFAGRSLGMLAATVVSIMVPSCIFLEKEMHFDSEYAKKKTTHNTCYTDALTLIPRFNTSIIPVYRRYRNSGPLFLV